MNLKEVREAIAIVRTRIATLTGQDPISYIYSPGDAKGTRYVWTRSYDGSEVTFGARKTLDRLWAVERNIVKPCDCKVAWHQVWHA